MQFERALRDRVNYLRDSIESDTDIQDATGTPMEFEDVLRDRIDDLEFGIEGSTDIMASDDDYGSFPELRAVWLWTHQAYILTYDYEDIIAIDGKRFFESRKVLQSILEPKGLMLTKDNVVVAFGENPFDY
jgi:hypothetical protein